MTQHNKSGAELGKCLQPTKDKYADVRFDTPLPDAGVPNKNCPLCSHDIDRHTGRCHYVGDCSGEECGCTHKADAGVKRPTVQGGDYRPHYRKRETDAYMDSLELQLKIAPDCESATAARYDAKLDALELQLTQAQVENVELAGRVEELEAMQPAVVTSDCGVIEGIFTSWEAAFEWANRHQMNESNIRGGVPFHDVQFPSSAASEKEDQQ